jgi:integrase
LPSVGRWRHASLGRQIDGPHRVSDGTGRRVTKWLVIGNKRERQANERVELAGQWPDFDYVFTTPIGTPIGPRNCTRVVQKACHRAGVRVVQLHDFRHGCVSVLLGLGVPPRTAMDIAGHSTIEMTMNVYGHVTLDEKRDALNRLGELCEETK